MNKMMPKTQNNSHIGSSYEKTKDIEVNVSNNREKLFKPLGPPPFNTVGLFTYLRTYARRHDDSDPESTIESWEECITRVVNATNTQLNVGFTEEELTELFSILYNLKCSVAGRFLWQLGTKTVDKMGLMSLQNCAFVTVDEPVKPFTWVMNFLMLGAGCGYRITSEDIAQIPSVKSALIVRKETNDADFIVPDSREGWVKLLGHVLKAHFYSGESFTYSCVLLRSRGAPIKGFGGLASGPEVLCDGIKKISNVLNKKIGQKISSVDALDIMNIIGQIVVSGNVRRSAQIALGDCNDQEYLRAKRWDLGGVPNWRCYSNNSVICNNIDNLLDNEDFWEGYHGNGEPYGLINLKLSQSCGRLGETQYPDPNVQGYNPCAEQSLESNETCCLAEIYLPNIKSLEELKKCATYLYRICKHSLRLDCPDSKETQQVVHKNMRMGIGVTGYLQASEKQKSWLSACYEHLRSYDNQYSMEKGFPTSIKLTTCKPSGTLSLLGGCTSGVHPGYSRYYIRRIRIASESPLIDLAKKHGYHVEYVKNFDQTIDPTTQVISFPYSLPEGTVFADECTAIQQLEYVKRLQTEWSDNSVSCTVYYMKDELPAIKTWLKENYNTCVKSVSFLLHSEHGFQQAPLEKISKEEYEKMIASCEPIKSVKGVCFTPEDEEFIADNECAGGACPLR
jgi:ribonucleoside-triphosphate reductase (thioredoxin)